MKHALRVATDIDPYRLVRRVVLRIDWEQLAVTGHIDRAWALRQRAQIVPQPLGISIRKKAFHLPVRALPDWHGARQQALPVSRQLHQAAAPVLPIRRNFDQSAPLQRL